MSTNHYPAQMVTGDTATTGMVSEPATNKVLHAYHDQGLEITQTQARRKLITDVRWLIVLSGKGGDQM